MYQRLQKKTSEPKSTEPLTKLAPMVSTRAPAWTTAQEYRQILEAERIATQVERERLNGADEHREGGHGVPAP